MIKTQHMFAVPEKGTPMTFGSLKTVAAATILIGAVASTSAQAAGGGATVEREPWTFSGITGKFDKPQLQRGFQVYKEVCSSCHGLKFLHWRNLGEAGGPGFSEAEIKALAAEAEVQDGPDDDGEMFDRPGLPSDSMGSPYANDNEARSANGGALPPDLSLIAKGRGVARPSLGFAPLNWVRDIIGGDETGGADYIYKLLTSYGPAPVYKKAEGGKLEAAELKDGREDDGEGDVKAGYMSCVNAPKEDGTLTVETCLEPQEGMNYNAFYEGHQIAMASPLTDDAVEYLQHKGQDPIPQTVDQHSRDVAAFLTWAAEPKLEERKSLGLRVMLYLIILSVLLYLTKKSLWARLKD